MRSACDRSVLTSTIYLFNSVFLSLFREHVISCTFLSLQWLWFWLPGPFLLIQRACHRRLISSLLVIPTFYTKVRSFELVLLDKHIFGSVILNSKPKYLGEQKARNAFKIHTALPCQNMQNLVWGVYVQRACMCVHVRVLSMCYPCVCVYGEKSSQGSSDLQRCS